MCVHSQQTINDLKRYTANQNEIQYLRIYW